MKRDVITLTEYQGFQDAYDFFNRELFEGSLPQVLVTLQRHANTRGYFSPERFNGRIDTAAVHELALNPDSFIGRTDEMILSTRVLPIHAASSSSKSFIWRALGFFR